MGSDQLERDIMEHPGRYAGEFFKKGDFETGWKLYSHREKDLWSAGGRNVGIPYWQGENLNGKRLVLGYEQALGEQILFASFFNELMSKGAKLTVEVDKRLVTLFQRSFPTCNIIPWQYPWHPLIRKGDYYALLGKPGKYLRTKLEDFPKENKWLVAKPYTNVLLSKPVIGCSWWSPVTPKNVFVEEFEPLKKFDCVTLQYGGSGPNWMYTPAGLDLNNDLDGVAAVINNCDYIVTISNTVAHLAGALGKPTYLLLSNSQSRHWYRDLPFYPTVTTVEKTEKETWKEKISEIVLDIEKSTNITSNIISSVTPRTTEFNLTVPCLGEH